MGMITDTKGVLLKVHLLIFACAQELETSG